MESYYIATFSTGKDKTLRLKITRARAGVDPEAAKAALRGMIEANALDPEYGRLTGATALRYVTVERSPFSVA